MSAIVNETEKETNQTDDDNDGIGKTQTDQRERPERR